MTATVHQIPEPEDDGRATSLLHTLRLFKPWLADPKVNEVAVNRCGEADLWIRGKWETVKADWLTYEYMEMLGNQVANYSANPWNAECPELSAYLPHGERVEMTRPPGCPTGHIYLNLRKHTSDAFTMGQFIDWGYFKNTRHVTMHGLSETDRERLYEFLEPDQKELWWLAKAGKWPEFLERSVLAHQNIIVSGATGSGKTSFIRSLIDFIPSWERLVTVEDTPEVSLPNHPHSQHLFYKKSGSKTGMSPKEALTAVMRKTISRCLLAELRGDEVFYFLQGVLNSGHPGGMATVHSNSCTNCFLRLTMLVKASAEGRDIPFEEIRQLLYSLVNVVAQLTFEPGAGRHVPGIFYDPMYAVSLMK